MDKSSGNHVNPRETGSDVPSHHIAGASPFVLLSKHKALHALLNELKPSIADIYHLARCSKSTWEVLSTDHEFWRDLYLATDPITRAEEQVELRKKLRSPKYYNKLLVTHQRTGLTQSVWLSTCLLLHRKPRLILVLAGKDPIIVRRLGQRESEAVKFYLSINYHLDNYLDDDEKRFAFEFPQVFQDLEVGDVVVTQDYKGAGCFSAVKDPESSVFLRLRKNGHDSQGLGILHRDFAPPSFPLFYWYDRTLEEAVGLDKLRLAGKQVYWYSYSHLKDKSMFSWVDHELLEEL